ncbi:hypothetical protein AB0B12_28075 [Streptomyces sp. NPDC044780]|uniref:hypothetical protein n=1 Tax=unclassified Streptomyces TaxID=2593676 RepID=UPI00340249B7
MWERGDSWVVLLVAEDHITYGAYDRAGIQVGRTIVDTLAQFRAGARSLAHPEYLVPALSGTGIADG